MSEKYSGSDHQHILFNIEGDPALAAQRGPVDRKWNTKSIDLEALRSSLLHSWSTLQCHPTPKSSRETENSVRTTMKAITVACDASMLRSKNWSRHRPAYWWTPEIAALRNKCHVLRRRATRAAKRTFDQASYTSEYKKAKKELNRTIKAGKASLWKEICNDLQRPIIISCSL